MVDSAVECLRSMRSACEAIDAAREYGSNARRVVVDDHALDGVDRRTPRSSFQHPFGVSVAGLPTRANTRRREVDVFGVILAVDLRRNQTDDMHRRLASPRRKLLHVGRLAQFFGNVLRKLANDVTQVMDLFLPSDVAAIAARILNVFLPAHHLP